MTTKTPFTIQTKSLARYLVLTNAVGFASLLLMTLVFGVLIATEEAANPVRAITIMLILLTGTSILAYAGAKVWIDKFVQSLGYELDGDTLRINQGVFNWERKAIPMDRVTDIRMSQGIVMRMFGIWHIHVQTASQGGTGAEGSMFAIENPKHVRETLLAARTTAVTR